eukprot:TRINITY_DN596_c3_g1_i1.p1 TRINITY_DN596_c3_g1~~TRINITY_DN596_c3_g1_i1.p1  ORF type:complete len:1186 (+),score=176.62 TRINITY_DN596_c3_g1_i1:132-3689(+)
MSLFSLLFATAVGGLLDTCKPDGCPTTAQPDFSGCGSSNYCECVSNIAKETYGEETDACIILVECLIDVVCPHVMSYKSQAVVSVYNEDTCNKDNSIYSGVLSPADDSCHRIHITSGCPETGVWCRAICYSDEPVLAVSMYDSREDCVSNSNPVVSTSFNTVNPSPCSEITLANGTKTYWDLNLRSCQHEKYNSPVSSNVMLVGEILKLKPKWVSNLPSSDGQTVTSNDLGVITYTSTTTGDLPNYCGNACNMILDCRGWNWNGGTGQCELLSVIYKGIQSEGLISGRSHPKFEATCIRWESTATSDTTSQVSTKECQDTCNTQPSHEHCGGSGSSFLDTYATPLCTDSPQTSSMFRLHAPADQQCHPVSEATPAYSNYYAAIKCMSYGVYIALYSDKEKCEESAKISPPHSETMLISLTQSQCADKARYWSAGNLNISWHVQGGSCEASNAREELSACRCAAVIEPADLQRSDVNKCHSYFGILSGTPIVPEENWRLIIPGSRDFENWWTLTSSSAYTSCGCTSQPEGDLETGSLCKNPETGSCSAPVTEGNYVCEDPSDVVCEVLPRDIKVNILAACEQLCFSVPGCRGFVMDVGGRCQLFSELTDIQSDSVTISADCQLSPDQDCILWQQRPSTYLHEDCSDLSKSPLPSISKCNWTSCHRRMTQSGNLFPTSEILTAISSCSSNCTCLVEGTKKAPGMSLMIPECEQFVDCLRTSNCSDYSEEHLEPQQTFNCQCASSYIQQHPSYDGKCCVSGQCGKCTTWHSRGYCVMSESNCIECGGTWCQDMTTAYVGQLCGCMRFESGGTSSDAPQLVCSEEDIFGTCRPMNDGKCPSGSTVCNVCECSRNCPDAECVPVDMFVPAASVPSSCGCVELTNAIKSNIGTVCTTITHPRVCGPAYLNNTCPLGTYACMGTSNNKMVLVTWSDGSTLFPGDGVSNNYFIEEFSYILSVDMLAIAFICPVAACPDDVCPKTEALRAQASCVNLPSFAHKMNFSGSSGISGTVVIGIIITRFPPVGHQYGSSQNAEDMITLQREELLRVSIVDAVSWNYSLPSSGDNETDIDPPEAVISEEVETPSVESGCGTSCDALSAVLPGFLIVALIGFVYYLCPSKNKWDPENPDSGADDTQQAQSDQPSPVIEPSPASSPHQLVHCDGNSAPPPHPQPNASQAYSVPSELEAFPT